MAESMVIPAQSVASDREEDPVDVHQKRRQSPKLDQTSVDDKMVVRQLHVGTQTVPTLAKGARVQVHCNSSNEPFRYGVIKWIGDVAGIQGLVAGIEMNQYMDGGNDGTLIATGQKFFTCQPGMGLYYPLDNLQPDEGSSDYYLRRWQESEASSKLFEDENKQLRYENDRLKYQLSQLQRQLSTVQQENQSLLSSQQESIAFGIEPWKVPRQAVELGRMIGGGGWGAVHQGNLRVAVKQFYPNILSKQNLSRLKREMQMLALIRHPNLLQFIAAVFHEHDDFDQNPPYIITELLDMSLRSAYEIKALLPSYSLLSVFQDTARALDYLHRRHEPIIHRDVSSANVLLKRQQNEKWIAKLSDLGSANLAREAYTLNEGARVYCAPEAFTFDTDARSAGTLTPKVDVYSYGIVLCEVATKSFPDKAEFPSMLARVRHEWPQLHQLIVACTNRSPEQRPNMASLLASLEAFPSSL